MTLYQLIFYVSLMLFCPSFDFYGAIKIKGFIIVIVEKLMEEVE